jgi:hypothetical protein
MFIHGGLEVQKEDLGMQHMIFGFNNSDYELMIWMQWQKLWPMGKA